MDLSTPRGTVLVAEDNAVNQLVARGMLEGLGYVVEFTQNGLEAVAALSESPGRFVAVLMDLRMPVLDGFAATRAIRQQERSGDRVPIIAVTASAMAGEKERCLDAGMDAFLVKPVSFELLESTLDHWITGTPPAAPSVPGTGGDGVLDLARIAMLQDLRSDGRSLFEQFVAAFLERVPADVEGIEAGHSRRGPRPPGQRGPWTEGQRPEPRRKRGRPGVPGAREGRRAEGNGGRAGAATRPFASRRAGVARLDRGGQASASSQPRRWIAGNLREPPWGWTLRYDGPWRS